jgi:hypothetical protein
MLSYAANTVEKYPDSAQTQRTPTGAANDDRFGLAHLRRRRSTAFALGEAKARRREISADAYLFLYKELVALAGDRTYCWPSLDFLAATLDTSEGTLKRWMKELERTDLIRRKPRPGGQTSLTYITAYLAPDVAAAVEDESPPETAVGQSGASPVAPADRSAHAEPPRPAPPQRGQAAQPALFFGPELQIVSDRRARSETISSTVKIQQFKNPGRCGGGTDQSSHGKAPVEGSPVALALLEAEAVCDPVAMAALQQKPLAELRAVSHYLDQQTNIQCRPGLFVWLARHDFGAQLLAGRHQPVDRGCPRAVPPPPVVEPPSNPALTTVWQAVQQQLGRVLPPEDLATWVAPTTLQAIEGQDIVLGTPNVFVRQELEGRFQAPLVAALEAVLGHTVVVHLIIGQL